MFILFCLLGIYSNIRLLTEFTRMRPCGTQSDREQILKTVTFYGVLAFIFNIWVLGRLLFFILALSMLVANAVMGILTILILVICIKRLFKKGR